MNAWQIVASLGCVIIAYVWIFRRRPDAQDPATMIVEVEQILDQFVTDMTERNDHLISQLAKLKAEQAEERKRWMERLMNLENRLAEMEQQMSRRDEEQVEAAEHHSTIHERYKELIALKRQGLSEDQIVKQTGMNHGEVKFILQLASQEENSR